MRTVTLNDPTCFRDVLNASARETIIVRHGVCRLILDGGRVLSCSGDPQVENIEPVGKEAPPRGRPLGIGDELEITNDDPTDRDLEIVKGT